MSFVQPRGRHRAPNKLSTSLNSTARVSAAVAIGGGLIASAVFAQSAQAAGTAGPHPATSSSPTTLIQVAAKHAAEPVAEVKAAQVKAVAASPAVSQVKDAVGVRTQITSVRARSYVAPVVPAPVAPAPTAPAPSAPAPVAAAPAPVVAAPATRSVRPSRSSGARRAVAAVSSTSTSTGTQPVSTPQAAPAATGGAVAIAQRFLGVPYVWGGSTPSGFDCSGFTSYVYAQLGINLPHNAAAQQAMVTRMGTPQPGDLLFFGAPAYHVAIYLGNGMMIDAPKPGDHVKIQSIYQTPSGYGRP